MECIYCFLILSINEVSEYVVSLRGFDVVNLRERN